jgi:hypothetical protein
VREVHSVPRLGDLERFSRAALSSALAIHAA